MREVKVAVDLGGCAREYVTGWFHGFFPRALESSDGNATYTVAIVEQKGGSVECFDPKDIVFLTPYKPET
jgi:hypothetical protein